MPIQSFQDLDVYQRTYHAMLRVLREVIPKLPREEKFDLADQLRRASKAAPALIAEGFAKRYQTKQWEKYLRDTMGECYEMINHLSVCRDVYSTYVQESICSELIETYTIGCKQLTKLSQAWQDFHRND